MHRRQQSHRFGRCRLCRPGCLSLRGLRCFSFRGLGSFHSRLRGKQRFGFAGRRRVGAAAVTNGGNPGGRWCRQTSTLKTKGCSHKVEEAGVAIHISGTGSAAGMHVGMREYDDGAQLSLPTSSHCSVACAEEPTYATHSNRSCVSSSKLHVQYIST